MNIKNAARIAGYGVGIGLLISLLEIFRMISYSPLLDAVRVIVSNGSIIYFFITFYQQASSAPSAAASITPSAPEKPQAAPAASVGDKNLAIGLIAIGGAGLFWVFIRMTSLAGKLCSWSPPFSEFETTTIVVGLISVLCVAIGSRKMMAKSKSDK
jgi:hypothetical protein